MNLAFINGVRNGVNKSFTLTDAGAGLVIVVRDTFVLKRVSRTPGPFEFSLDGLNIVIGSAPAVGSSLFAYIQPDTTVGLLEVQLFGIKNNSNLFFTLSAPVPTGTSVIIFRNGLIVVPETAGFEAADFEPADYETTDFLADGSSQPIIKLPIAPGPLDELRAFIASPATALVKSIPLDGSQDGLNTRYTFSDYAPTAGTEANLWVFVDGRLQTRTLIPPLGTQYLTTSPIQFVLGGAPSSTTALEVIVIGGRAVLTNAYQFTLEKLSRRLGIWLARGLDEAECEEMIRETYREYMEMYQWSFLQYEGAFTTEPMKIQGTVSATQLSRTVQGTGTAFGAEDVGKRLRMGVDDVYEVTAVDVFAQRLEIQPAFAGDTSTSVGYTLLRNVYSLGVDAGYIFSMTSQNTRLIEVALTTLDTVDPDREGYSTGESIYYAYRGRSENDELRVEIYPSPTTPQVIRYTAIRREALTDGSQKLRGIETIILNAAAAAGCRTAMAKGGKSTAEMWLALMQSYEAKVAQLVDRIETLDWTRSDVARVQRMRGDGTTYGGDYAASHDVGWGDEGWDN